MALWGFEAKCWSGLDWSGYPLECYDYWSTCGAKNEEGDAVVVTLVFMSLQGFQESLSIKRVIGQM